MKLTRKSIRKLILEELDLASSLTPSSVASQVIKDYGESSLSTMTEAELESVAYATMSDVGAMGDDWPDFLDQVVEILVNKGLGQGSSVMGFSI